MSGVADVPGVGEARVRRRRRIPAIWIIPVLAIAIGAWLAWDTLSSRGPTITVQFQSAEGLTPGQSQLKFKDLTLGTVKNLALTAGRSRVTVTIAMVREAADLISDRAVFWVAKPRLFAGSLSGLGTLSPERAPVGRNAISWAWRIRRSWCRTSRAGRSC